MVKIAKREALKHTEEQRSMLKDKFGVNFYLFILEENIHAITALYYQYVSQVCVFSTYVQFKELQ